MRSADRPDQHRPRGVVRLVTLGVTALALILAACGGGAVAPSPTAVAKATLAPATTAPATPAPTATPAAAAVVNVEAYQEGSGFLFKADQIAVPAGKVTFNFRNDGKQTHELMVYPLQDLSAMLAQKRQGKDVDEMKYIKDMAGEAADIDPGKSATFDATLKPGFYELACHVIGKNPDGSTFLHYDKGQTLTLAVTGPGGPAASVGTASNTVAVEMKGEETSSWLFVPDHLVLSAGEVNFKATNSMMMEHDFVLHPLGDITPLVTFKLQGPGSGFDYGKVKGTELFADLPAGKTDTKTFKLTPGYWVAACYMVSKGTDGTSFIHRDRGQRIVFLVK